MLLFKGNKARLGAVAFIAGIDPQVMDVILWHGTGEDITICLFAQKVKNKDNFNCYLKKVGFFGKLLFQHPDSTNYL